MASSQYEHENYVQIDSVPTEKDQWRTLIAAKCVTEILSSRLDSTVRWAFRGFVALRCHVPDIYLYRRYTDDLDMIVDSDSTEPIDRIESVLIKAAPAVFQKRLSPSKLLKVHYLSEDGVPVRLDIYNTTMHNVGANIYRNFEILSLNQPQQFADIAVFSCPVLSAAALTDLKMVACAERRHQKDLDDIFFVLLSLLNDQKDPYPWCRAQAARAIPEICNKLQVLRNDFQQQRPDWNFGIFDTNTAILESILEEHS